MHQFVPRTASKATEYFTDFVNIYDFLQHTYKRHVGILTQDVELQYTKSTPMFPAFGTTTLGRQTIGVVDVAGGDIFLLQQSPKTLDVETCWIVLGVF